MVVVSCFIFELFWIIYSINMFPSLLLFCGRRRAAVARYRIICPPYIHLRYVAGAASQAVDANPSRAPGLTSGFQGSVNVHRGVLLLVPQWQCISSFVFYFVLLVKWHSKYMYWCIDEIRGSVYTVWVVRTRLSWLYFWKRQYETI